MRSIVPSGNIKSNFHIFKLIPPCDADYFPLIALPAPASHHPVALGNPDDFTGGGAGTTLERGSIIFNLADIESPEAAAIRRYSRVFMHQQSRTDSSHDLVVGRHDDIRLKLLPQRPDDAPVESDASLEHHRRLYFLARTDIAEVIAHQRPAETVNNVFHIVSHLLLMHHVRLGENGTAAGHADCFAAQHCQAGKLLDTQAEARRLVVEKAAGASGAHRIHGEIRHHAIADDNELAVLPADFNDRPHLRDSLNSRQSLAGNFILNEVGTDNRPGEVTGAAGSRHAFNLSASWQQATDLPQPLLNHRYRPAAGRQIQVGYQVVNLIQHGELGRNRPYINSKIGFHNPSLNQSYTTKYSLPRWVESGRGVFYSSPMRLLRRPSGVREAKDWSRNNNPLLLAFK